MHDLRGITFCPSINQKQPVMFLVREMRYLILSVPLNLLVLKENRGSHFVQRRFLLINISLNIVYLVIYLYMLCNLTVDVMSRLCVSFRRARVLPLDSLRVGLK